MDLDDLGMKAPKASISNPRRLPATPGAALALDDLGPPKVTDNSAQSFCISRYKECKQLSRFAEFCRNPMVRQVRSLDHLLLAQ